MPKLMDEIRSLIKILEESDLAEIEVARWWGWGRVRVTKTPSNHSSHLSSAPENGSRSGAANGSAVATHAVPAPPPAPPAAPPAEDRYVPVRSPMVGTFYRAPAPDADPYIEPGQMVEVGQTVCIIEAMKLMNEIESDVRGRIVAVKADNRTAVEYGQVLFLVDPS